MVKSLYSTRPGEQESLYYQGQPVVELREEVQEILDVFARTYPDFPAVYLAEPVLGRDGTTDWYGQNGDSAFSEMEKPQAAQAYYTVRRAILSWAQTRPENMEADLLEILPLVLTVPSVDFLQRNAKGNLVLTAWGHRSLSGWLEKGDVFGNVPIPEQKIPLSADTGLVSRLGTEKTSQEAQSEQIEISAEEKQVEESEKKEALQEPLREAFISEEIIEEELEKEPLKEKIIWKDRVVHVPLETENWWRRPTVFWPISGILWACFMLGTLLMVLVLGSSFAICLFPLAILCLLIWLAAIWLRKIWGWLFAALGVAFLVALLLWLLFSRSFFWGPSPVIISAPPIVGSAPLVTVPQTPLPQKELQPAEVNIEDSSNLLNRSHQLGGVSGAMEIVLSWEGPDDLDLHVKPPNGEEIAFDRPQSAGGALDVDANANPAKMQAHPLEHVTWEKDPPVGAYNLMPVFYRSRNNGQPVPYHLDVYSHGKLSHEYQGTLGHQGDRNDFTFDIFPPDEKKDEILKEETPKVDMPETPVSDPDSSKEEIVSQPEPEPISKIVRQIPQPVKQEQETKVPAESSPVPLQPKWDIQGTLSAGNDRPSFGASDVPQSSGLVAGAQGKAGNFGNGDSEGGAPSSDPSKGWQFSHKILGMKHSE